jgi:hypothetical protein
MYLNLIKKLDQNQKYIYLLPGYIFNFFSTSALLVIVYFSDLNYLAADLGLASSFLLFICHFLSLNERGVLLAEGNLDRINSAFIFRLQSSLILLFIASLFFISQNIFNIFTLSISILIISQWCIEIFLIKCETKKIYKYLKFNIIASAIYILTSVILIFNGKVLIFSVFTISYNLIILTLCLSTFKKLNLFFDYINYYRFFLKKNLHSNRLTSSFFISVSNFYFRYFIYILFSKELAASVFTFFTLGSFPASIYSLILAPSLIKDKYRFKDLNILLIIYTVYFCVGVGLLFSYYNQIEFAKNLNFLIAGLSMIGSIIMIYAFHKRQILIHNKKSRSLCFQIDIFYSLSVISIIPLIYSIGSNILLPAAFLFTSIIAYLFYGLTIKIKKFQKNLYFFILFLFLPIYIILFDNNFVFFPKIYFSTDPFFSSSFSLNTLPIPLSFFLILIIFYLFVKNYLIDRDILYVFSLTIILGLTSISVLKYNLKSENIYILLQFSFPFLAFIIGNQFAKLSSQHLKFFKSLFFIYLFIILLQFFDIFNSKDLILSSNISSFGVYKHLQYVSQFIGISFLISIAYLIRLNYFNKLQIFILILLTNIYLILSTSISGFIYTGILSLLMILIFMKEDFAKRFNYLYFGLFTILSFFVIKIQFDHQASYIVETTYFKIINFLPLLSDRILSIFLYLREIYNFENFLFGKNNLDELNPLFNTSFNYFVDFIYNLGFLTLLPLIYLIVQFFINFLNYIKKSNSKFIIFLSISILIFLIIDTFIKSSLRELYTGSLLYFFWGYSFHYLRKR